VALEYKVNRSDNRADAGAISLTLPGGTVATNLLIGAVLQQQNSGGTTIPVEFTSQLAHAGGASEPEVKIGTRIVGAAEAASYDFGVGELGGVAALLRIAGVDTANPVNVQSAPSSSTGLSATSPSVTTTVANCLILYFCIPRRPAVDITFPASTEQGILDDKAGGGPAIAVAVKYQATAGVTGTADWEFANSSTGTVTYTIAIQPDENLLPGLGQGIVVSVEALDIPIANAANSGSASLTLGQTLANCVPFGTWQSGGATDAHRNRLIDFQLASGPNRCVAQRQGVTDAMTAKAYVVEFAASRVRVQKGSFLMLSLDGDTSAPLSPAVDPDHAFVVAYWGNTDTGDDLDDVCVGYRIASDGASVLFNRTGTTGNMLGSWYVVEALDGAFSVQHFEDTFELADGEKLFDVSPEVNRYRTFVIGSYTCSLADDNPGDQWGFSIQTPAIARGDRGSAPNSTGTIWLSVIELADGVGNVQHGEFGTSDAEDEDFIDTVDLDFSHPVLSASNSSGDSSDEGDSARAEAMIRLSLDDANTIALDRLAGSTTAVGGHWSVVQWAEFVARSGQVIGGGYRHY
jgi:hypothetical protein